VVHRACGCGVRVAGLPRARLGLGGARSGFARCVLGPTRVRDLECRFAPALTRGLMLTGLSGLW
jgi:hypothetical protein